MIELNCSLITTCHCNLNAATGRKGVWFITMTKPGSFQLGPARKEREEGGGEEGEGRGGCKLNNKPEKAQYTFTGTDRTQQHTTLHAQLPPTCRNLANWQLQICAIVITISVCALCLLVHLDSCREENTDGTE